MPLSHIKVSKQGPENGVEIQHKMRMSKLKYHKKKKKRKIRKSLICLIRVQLVSQLIRVQLVLLG